MKTEIIRDSKKQGGLGGIKFIPETNEEFTILKRFWDENDSSFNYTTDCVLELILDDAKNIDKTKATVTETTTETRTVQFTADISILYKVLTTLALIVIILSGLKYLMPSF